MESSMLMESYLQSKKSSKEEGNDQVKNQTASAGVEWESTTTNEVTNQKACTNVEGEFTMLNQAGQSSPTEVRKRRRKEVVDEKYRNKRRMAMDDCKRMRTELQILKQELEYSMEREKLKDQWLQEQKKFFEVVQSQVSSMIYNNDIQNQHIRSLFLELQKVSKERDEFKREGKNEVKEESEKFQNGQ